MAKKKLAKQAPKKVAEKRAPVKKPSSRKRPAKKAVKKMAKAAKKPAAKKTAASKKRPTKKAVPKRKIARKKKMAAVPTEQKRVAGRGQSLQPVASPVTPAGPGPSDPIKHVVVLMFENHSFDQMLGCMKAIYPGLDGVDPANVRSNKNSTGDEYFQKESNDTVVSPDPMHELDHVLNQLKDGNSGFVSEYEKEYVGQNPDLQRIMDYFGVGDLAALHELARHFTICDRWYSSVPGPTWTNRFFVHSGTSKGVVTMPKSLLDTKYYLHYDQDTIFDRLNLAKKTWRVYFGDVPQSLVLVHQRRPENAIHYRLIHKFYDDVDDGTLPEYSFIEPCYHKGEQNDDHPPHSTIRAQRLLASVYNALRKNEAQWTSTLLVVLYDEHGGFYDHASPPNATPPAQFAAGDEYSFDRLGVRVPALLISPWVDRGVFKTDYKFDHTSLLKYLTEKWNLAPLTDRVREAKSFAGAIRTTGRPRNDTPESVPAPPLVLSMAAAALPTGAAADMTADELTAPDNDLQKSLAIFAEHLETNELPVEAHLKVLAVAGPLSEGTIAKQRVLAFLNHQSSKLGGSGP
jgi:phospholipase C